MHHSFVFLKTIATTDTSSSPQGSTLQKPLRLATGCGLCKGLVLAVETPWGGIQRIRGSHQINHLITNTVHPFPLTRSMSRLQIRFVLKWCSCCGKVDIKRDVNGSHLHDARHQSPGLWAVPRSVVALQGVKEQISLNSPTAWPSGRWRTTITVSTIYGRAQDRVLSNQTPCNTWSTRH